MKTGRKFFLMGDMVDEHQCDDCEEICNDIGFYYWGNRDFTLCNACLIETKTFDRLFFQEKPKRKEPIPVKLKWEIFNRDNYTCQYCSSRYDLTIDHIIPESQGGTIEKTNLVTACKTCNSKKGPRTPEEIGMVLSNDPRE